MTNLSTFNMKEFANQYKNSPLYQEYKKYMQEHPFAAFAITIIAAFSFIPVMTFICFILITVLLSLLGFMFFQCTVLTIGMLMLGGVLFVIVLFTAGATTVLAVTWWITRRVHGLFCGKAIRHLYELTSQKDCVEYLNGGFDHKERMTIIKEE